MRAGEGITPSKLTSCVKKLGVQSTLDCGQPLHSYHSISHSGLLAWGQLSDLIFTVKYVVKHFARPPAYNKICDHNNQD